MPWLPYVLLALQSHVSMQLLDLHCSGPSGCGLHMEPADEPVLGVTPSLLHAPTVRSLGKELERIHEDRILRKEVEREELGEIKQHGGGSSDGVSWREILCHYRDPDPDAAVPQRGQWTGEYLLQDNVA